MTDHEVARHEMQMAILHTIMSVCEQPDSEVKAALMATLSDFLKLEAYPMVTIGTGGNVRRFSS